MTTIQGIKKVRTGWMIDVDEYTRRERYYTGSIAGQKLIIVVDPTESYNDWFPLVADMIIERLHDGQLPTSCKVYRKGWVVE